MTRLNELEVEIQAYVDECTRLKHHLHEIIKERDSVRVSPVRSE